MYNFFKASLFLKIKIYLSNFQNTRDTLTWHDTCAGAGTRSTTCPVSGRISRMATSTAVSVSSAPETVSQGTRSFTGSTVKWLMFIMIWIKLYLFVGWPKATTAWLRRNCWIIGPEERSENWWGLFNTTFLSLMEHWIGRVQECVWLHSPARGSLLRE